jgi:lipoprotein NlpI
MRCTYITLMTAGLTLCAIVACGASEDGAEELLQQATAAAQRRDHTLAIARLTEVIEKHPKTTVAWYLRGREHFRAGKIKEAVADFDRYVELVPKAESQQWERGIAYYYAGQYQKGAKQFEDYQTFHSQDVENSAWRYLCVAKTDGVDKAQANLLKIDRDSRVPMMEIYALYQGQMKPENVLAAAGDENQPLFYAHLYIGLWHEVAGRAEEAKKHLFEAEKHKIGHYMWDVAHVHAERLRQTGK